MSSPLSVTELETLPNRPVRWPLTLVKALIGLDPPGLYRRIRPLDTTTGYMAAAIARDGPIAPSQDFREFTVRVQ